LETEKPPGFGLIQRGAEVVLHRLKTVQQKTIRPSSTRLVAQGSPFYTHEYTIYDRLAQWAYDPHSVQHSPAEYARDEDAAGFHEVQVNTLPGGWSLLRSWLRPPPAISQEPLPLYLALFEFAHTSRLRAKALLHS